ncbi:Cysteine-rich repeat secretory protein 55 [Apostasia shenzhenica]|uniref:Cysteine-rich repeat secretory protein 55 n=1 Tax=Apostasia shenzhenica TaxID=1088818 RepID=A0A2I0A4U7_9ASPA|nr:Cysteine-rich repeat secretory protein 55 [Apostasia shenzhenica]
MAFSNHLFLLALLLLLPMASSAANLIYRQCDKNFTDNNALSTNIKTVLSDLQTRAPQTGFANSTATGASLDQVYGLAQCQGNAQQIDCSDCLATAITKISECTNQTMAYIWYNLCFVRISNENFFGSIKDGVGTIFNDFSDALNPIAFSAAVHNLTSQLLKNVLDSGAKMFGIATADVTGTEGISSISGVAQCTADLKLSTCYECLNWAVLQSKACETKKSCSILHSSCTISFR